MTELEHAMGELLGRTVLALSSRCSELRELVQTQKRIINVLTGLVIVDSFTHFFNWVSK